MAVDHLGGGMSVTELLRQVRQLATKTIQNAAIGRAGIRVYDGGWIRIEGGGLEVAGTQTVTGTLSVSGELNADGTITLSGPVTISGATEITGNTTLTGDMTVNGGGEITIAGSVPMSLGVTSNGRPGVEFSGGRMSSDGSRIAMESGGSAVGAAPTFASISNGSAAMVARNDGPYIMGLPTTTNPPNLYVNPTTGKLYRSTAGGIEA